MNKNIYKASAIAVMTGMLATFTHCVSEESAKTGAASNSTRAPSSNTTGGSSGGATGVAAIEVTTGVKNHEQILQTMSALTGIPVTTTAIANTYNDVAPTLPTTNDVKALLAPNNVAVVKLAAEFCSQLIDGTNASRDMLYNTAVGGAALNFANITLAQLTTNRMIFIQKTVDNFWGGMISQADLAMSETELSQLFMDLSVGETANNAGARKVAKGVCTAVLSSAHVTLL